MQQYSLRNRVRLRNFTAQQLLSSSLLACNCVDVSEKFMENGWRYETQCFVMRNYNNYNNNDDDDDNGGW
jgi:hypothetical protein